MTWVKHDGTNYPPVALKAVVEIETFTPGTHWLLARDVNWSLVKFYKVIDNETIQNEAGHIVQDRRARPALS